MKDQFVVAVDIGGTSYRVALADEKSSIINRISEPTRSWESHETGLDRIKRCISQVISAVDFQKVVGIAVCAGGPLDPQNGILLTPPSLSGWRNAPIKDTFQESFNIPVWVENDADLAVLGEQQFGAGRRCDRLIYITVSTGIGGGIITDGKILRGTDLSIAEIGHIVVDPNGPQCNCGGRGHVETLASGTAIVRIATERISKGEASSLCGLDLTGEMVVKAAIDGDLLANQVIESAGSYLGMAIASLVHLFDPQVVIIGGGISNAGELILEPARRALSEYSMADYRNRARIVQSELGDNSGIMGAIAFAWDKLRDV